MHVFVLTELLLSSGENTKKGAIYHFNDHNFESKHDSQTNDPILFLHLKAFKIQFCWVPPLLYVLICKIHIQISKMNLSSLLKQISFFYINFANFWYLTCFLPDPMDYIQSVYTLYLMVSTIIRLKVVQWAQYVHLHMPTFSWENLRNFIHTRIFETFQHFAVVLQTTFFSYGT